MIDCLLVIIELFRYLLCLKAEICRSRCVSKGVGHFERKCQTEGGVAYQPLLVSKTRVIALSSGIKMSVVHCLVLSHSKLTRMTDGRTDGQTELRQLIPR